VRAERSDAGSAAGRGYPSPRAGGGAPRDRGVRGSAPDPRSARAPQHPGEARRPSAAEQRTGSSTPGRSRTAPAAGPRLRGTLAVLGVFLLTLVAAAADSYIGLGLGTITLVALTAGTVVAALAVRRRDLLSVLIAPPLVFVAVAVVNTVLAPSATLNLPTMATLLVRGFPAMGIATAAGLVIGLFRLATKR
jgi:hypothetical protein